MASRGFNGGVVTAGVFLVALGVFFLLLEAGIVELDIKYVAPAVLIVLGLWIVMRGLRVGPTPTKQDIPNDGSFETYRPRRPPPTP
ncbi:MAG TPA: DUF5668 domain-containing protein [Actinomycetota bacterium]|nr:DUF5668 domain-containing protein [Actinomycetota bacterium]